MSYPPLPTPNSDPIPPYPSPYAQQYGTYGYGYQANPLDTLLAPARRAGILLFLIGVLGVVFGGCIILAATQVTVQQISSEPQLRDALTKSGLTAEQMKAGLIALGAILAVAALVLGILGFFVRGGAKTPVYITLAVAGFATLLCLLWTGLGLLQGQPQALCVLGVPLAMLGLLVVWLVQASMNTGQIAQWRLYFASAQQMGGYAPTPQYNVPQASVQSGYLSTPPPPPPPPPPSPPPSNPPS